jgi:hypothetical protein
MSSSTAWSDRRVAALAAGALAGCVLALLGDLLLLPGDRVVSSELGDVAYYFARIRRFAVLELTSGNFPLWNPYIFAGLPLHGGFQGALLYPPNAIYLVLPLAKAINFDFALHLFLTGFGTFAWVRQRGVDPRAAVFAGVVAMFCGASLLRMYAGQPTLLAANAWTPWLLWVVERTLARPSLSTVLLGIGVATLQILAGYPFAVFASGLVGGLYALLRLRDWQQPARVVASLAAIAAVPLLLCAAQLLPGLATSLETTRAGGVPYEFASSYSLPLENVLTALVPQLFGDGEALAYWGRWWFWDASIFLGITALTLAGLGALRGPVAQRRFALLLAGLCLAVAFGDRSFVYDLFYRWVPGFDSFRAPSKLAYHASLFVALLAAVGLERLWAEPRGARLAGTLVAALAVGLALGGTLLRVDAQAEPGGGHFGALVETIEPWLYTEAFAREAAAFAERALHGRALACGLLALLLLLRARTPRVVGAIALLGTVELFAFAFAYRGGIELGDLERPKLAAFYRDHPGDHRFFSYARRDRAQDNYGMDARVHNLWGYDPVQLARFSRFLEFAREESADFETPPIANQPDELHPIFRVLRVRHALPRRGPRELADALPRLVLFDDYRVVPEDEALLALIEPGFDPARTVVLESPPEPPPVAGGRAGRVRLVEEGTDHLLVDVDLTQPAILLVTDTFAEGWRAVEIGPDDPQSFPVVPGDYVARAVALPAGARRLRIEYAPAAFRIGVLVSGLSLAGFALVASVHAWRRATRS